MIIKFYSTRKPYGCFSNFSVHPIIVNGINYQTSEHYFQAHKFAYQGTDFWDVVNASSPKEAANIGRDRNRPLRKDWESVKECIMYNAVLNKMLQHKYLLETLLDTGDAELIEDSPIDYYWGCGASGEGKNRLGCILMMIRDAFQKIRLTAYNCIF